jgi:DNA-binding transcriptional regulator YbjK
MTSHRSTRERAERAAAETVLAKDSVPPAGGRRPCSDLHRADRIAAAALMVIGRHGIGALTHRAVAAEAGVPLGSTTYHFATLDDILIAAVRIAIAESASTVSEWTRSLGAAPDLAAELTDLLLRRATTDQRTSVVGYELYIAALRRPALQPLSLDWSALMTNALRRFVDDATASALGSLYDGLLMRVLVTGHRFDRRQVEQSFRWALGTGEFAGRPGPREDHRAR